MSANEKTVTDNISSDSLESNPVHKEENGESKAVSSEGKRVISEWEAIQIAAAGDLATIDAEVNELDAQLHQPKNRWYRYQLSFEDPKYFTWLLVGFASMGGLLSGVDRMCNPFVTIQFHIQQN